MCPKQSLSDNTMEQLCGNVSDYPQDLIIYGFICQFRIYNNKNYIYFVNTDRYYIFILFTYKYCQPTVQR